MKKMKRFLALALAFVVVVTLLPVTGKEVKAAEDGFYVWYPNTDGNTFAESVLAWETVGTPSTTCENFITVVNTNLSKTLGFALSTEYTTAGKNGWGSYDGATCSKAGLKVGSNCEVDIVPTCDGTIRIYWAPKAANVVSGKIDSVKFDGSTYAYDLPDILPVDAASATIDMQVIEKNVVSGTKYVLSRGNNEARLCMITFTPAAEKSVVSTIGAAYREAGGSWRNGVRFGAELDKKSADFVNDNIVESGTLVARQDAVGVGTELEVDMDKCKKVVRTTVWKETDNVLQYTLVVTNIPEENKDTVLVARPYVKLKDGTYIYGDQISGSWNSVAAEAASEN